VKVDVIRAERQARFAVRKTMFGKVKKLYFVGIGGAGMSGIAEILHNLGYEVSGSDTTPSEITEYLGSLGITIHTEHAARWVHDIDVVVISSAVGESNPEVVEARRQGIPVIKRAEMLGELMRLKYSIGIAGTHGKTTTTSMIGRILRQAGLRPTLIVGGVVAELGTGASLGEGEYLVAEVDEYDRSIFAMFPTMAIVLNVEPDHMDCYADLDDLEGAFLSYINRVPFYGSAVISADDPRLARLRSRMTRPHVTFGFSADADYRAVEINRTREHTTFSVFRRGELLGNLLLHVPGQHNIANALAATAAATELDVPFATIADALREFTGVGRRFELVAKVNGITVIDDYAHHPTEIRATLTAARDQCDGRLIAVFQPHLFSRTRDFVKDFAAQLALADHCILTDIYPAREQPIPGVTSDRIRAEAEALGHRNFSYVGVKENAIDAVARVARPGDMVLLIGAGSITHIRSAVAKRLEVRA
jgi:UDP-N-acetylmuramate--alanine ligase